MPHQPLSVPAPAVVLQEFLDDAQLTVDALATEMPNPSEFRLAARGAVPISARMAILLSERFDTSAEFWLDIQTRYDLARARRLLAFSDAA